MTTTVNDAMIAEVPLPIDAETYEPISRQVVTLHDPTSPAAEQYRLLRHQVERLARSGYKAIAFTSAESGEGRTTTVVNTALALGFGGKHRVALVDADLRRPRVHELLGLKAREGLCDVVAGRVALAGALWRFGRDQLYVLPCGNVPEQRSVTLYDPRLGALFAELKEKFDFVLVDCPSVLRLADVPTLCQSLDGALLVVRAGVTKRALVGAAIDALDGIPLHGVILNGAEGDLSILRRSYEGSEMPALPAAAER